MSYPAHGLILPRAVGTAPVAPCAAHGKLPWAAFLGEAELRGDGSEALLWGFYVIPFGASFFFFFNSFDKLLLALKIGRPSLPSPLRLQTVGNPFSARECYKSNRASKKKFFF